MDSRLTEIYLSRLCKMRDRQVRHLVGRSLIIAEGMPLPLEDSLRHVIF